MKLSGWQGPAIRTSHGKAGWRQMLVIWRQFHRGTCVCVGGRDTAGRGGGRDDVWRLCAVGERSWIAQCRALEIKGKVPCVCSMLLGERECWDSIKSPLCPCWFRATLKSLRACVFAKGLWMGPSPRRFVAGSMQRCEALLQRCEVPRHRTATAL